jgi:predicted transcriptional regulator
MARRNQAGRAKLGRGATSPAGMSYQSVIISLRLLEDFWAEVKYGTRRPRDHSMKVLRIGIISMDAFKARTIAIAKGVKSRPGDPKIWFNSAQSIGKLIDDNWPLLQEIRRRPPQSITELAGRTGRSVSNLSRTLKSLEQRGLVSLHVGQGLNKRPVVAYDRIEMVTVPFADAA